MTVKRSVSPFDLELLIALHNHDVAVHWTNAVIANAPHGAPHDLAVGRTSLNDSAVTVDVTDSNDSAHTCFSRAGLP